MSSPNRPLKVLGTVLLVAEEKDLFDIYSLNLKNYLSSELIHAKSFDQACELLGTHPKIGAIITKSQIKTEKTAQLFKQKIDEEESHPPVIIIGEDHKIEELGERMISVDSPASVKSILKNCSAFLKITAKAMVELQVPRFYPFHVDYFLESPIPPCDIYLYEAENDRFYKRFTGGYAIDLDRLKKDRDAGLKEVFILSDFRLELTNKITDQLLEKMNKGEMENDERKKVTDRAMTIIGSQFRETELTENTVKLAHASIQSLQKIVGDNAELSTLLKNLVKESTSYRFKHCQLLIYFSNIAIDNMQWGTKEHKDKMAFSVFFHDLFLYNDEEAMIERDEEIEALVADKLEGERIKSHALLASEKISKFPRSPLGADQIVLQHHGSRGGKGYNQSPGPDLAPLTQVFLVCEALAKKVLFYEQGDDFMMAVKQSLKELEDQFKRASYRKIVYALQDAKWE